MKNTAISSIVFLSVITASCINRKDSPPINISPVAGSSVMKAERFSLQHNDSCTILTIFDPWQGAESVSQVYYLVKRGSESAIKADPSQIISVPVRKIICMSSTHLAMISALGEDKSIYGISGAKYIY
ncbi:MAG: hypothetical protein NT092_02485, partial [Bacteroidia bacterium]|nr:hypothetical protein [Bacteroidia bacterium]